MNDCRAVARQLIAMHSQPTFVYIYMSVTLWAPGPHPGFKMASLTVLWTPFSKPVVREESSIWTTLPHHFSKRGLLQLPG